LCASFGPSSDARSSTAYFVRNFGTQFLHQPSAILAAGAVWGIFYLERSDFIDHMRKSP